MLLVESPSLPTSFCVQCKEVFIKRDNHDHACAVHPKPIWRIEIAGTSKVTIGMRSYWRSRKPLRSIAFSFTPLNIIRWKLVTKLYWRFYHAIVAAEDRLLQWRDRISNIICNNISVNYLLFRHSFPLSSYCFSV